jgi:hypothetical protein
LSAQLPTHQQSTNTSVRAPNSIRSIHRLVPQS